MLKSLGKIHFKVVFLITTVFLIIVSVGLLSPTHALITELTTTMTPNSVILSQGQSVTFTYKVNNSTSTTYTIEAFNFVYNPSTAGQTHGSNCNSSTSNYALAPGATFTATCTITIANAVIFPASGMKVSADFTACTPLGDCPQSFNNAMVYVPSPTATATSTATVTPTQRKVTATATKVPTPKPTTSTQATATPTNQITPTIVTSPNISISPTIDVSPTVTPDASSATVLTATPEDIVKNSSQEKNKEANNFWLILFWIIFILLLILILLFVFSKRLREKVKEVIKKYRK